MKDLINETIKGIASHNSVDLTINTPVNIPSRKVINQIIMEIKSLLFPGYFCDIDDEGPGKILERLQTMLFQQVKAGFCFSCPHRDSEERHHLMNECNKKVEDVVCEVLKNLPKMKGQFLEDIEATFSNDPAATSRSEVIFSYPSIRAIIHQRIAHLLYELKTPILPRVITEMAHSKTGIDIHPGAQISPGFFIDHGTGVVIGETCIIGKKVTIYQGVTLGAKNFKHDESGSIIKGNMRHPIIEDGVTIYAGATILGRITIGKNSIIGGNVWITKDVAPNSKILQQRAVEQNFEYGAGI